MKIGAHISASGGALKIFDRAQSIGANCFQIFASSPRMWRVNSADPQVAQKFKQKLKETEMNPSFIHIKYLVNLVSPKEETVTKSIQAVIDELKFASDLGLQGGMFHIGAHQGADPADAIDMLVQKSNQVLSQIPEDVYFILENSATSKKLGAKLEQIATIIEKLNHPQVRVCLDTAHAFESGYDLRTEENVNDYIEQVDKTIGLDLVALFHVNDSKTKLGSNNDRHENIGSGEIGLTGFKTLINHPKTKNKPFILEVPGENKSGPNRENIDIMKSLIK